jgi:hypothetical protein
MKLHRLIVCIHLRHFLQPMRWFSLWKVTCLQAEMQARPYETMKTVRTKEL